MKLPHDRPQKTGDHFDLEQGKVLLFLAVLLLVVLLGRNQVMRASAASMQEPLKDLVVVQGEQFHLVDAKSDSSAPHTENSSALPAVMRPMVFAPLPINSADKELLMTVPGIGPRMAQRIIDTRTALHGFHGPEQLVLVPGIGRKRMVRFQSLFSFEQ